MGKYDRKDRFYKKAKQEGLVSRASYKLEQIQKQYKLIERGDKVLDFGCAPGSWLQIASKIVGKSGRIFGIDILPVRIGEISNIEVLQADVTSAEIVSTIKKRIDRADVIISDMAPSTSGIKFRDSYLSYELARTALDIAKQTLKTGGNFVTKIFPGEEFAGFKKELASYFERVDQFRPEATRKTSIEVYLIGIGYKG